MRTKMTMNELYERYDEMLDEIYGETKVTCYGYETSRVLKAVDPVAYQVGFDDWLDGELTDGQLEEENGAYYCA